MVTISDRDTMAAIAAASVSPDTVDRLTGTRLRSVKNLSGSEPPVSREIPGRGGPAADRADPGRQLRVASTERPVRSTYVHFAQAARHRFGMRAFRDPFLRPDPQCLKGLVMQLPAVVVPHGTILPDHKIKAGYL